MCKTVVLVWVGIILSAHSFFVSAQAQAAPPGVSNCLSIEHFRSGEVLHKQKLATHFSLSFIHSVSNTPVRDYYVIIDGNIIQTGTRFNAQGAGLPSHESEGIEWKNYPDFLWLSMDRPITKLIVRTDKNYKNRLHLNDRFTEQVTPPAEAAEQTINLNQWTDSALLIQTYTCSTEL